MNASTPATRRSFLTTLGTLAASPLFARDFGPGAAPVRYPEPDVIALDPKFAKYKIGSSPLQRLHTGMLWAEGLAWSGTGGYLMGSDIPNNVQHRWLAEDGHISTLRKPAGNSNGNTFDAVGRQIYFQARNNYFINELGIALFYPNVRGSDGSPTANAAKINKPLFVVQGQNDPRVPVSEAAQMVAAVRQNGTPVWYLPARDEGHGFAKKPNADFQFHATILFLQEHLLK